MAYSILSLLWLLCGFAAVVAMLLRLGSRAAWAKSPMILWAHRILGGSFVIGYIIFLICMIGLYQVNAPRLPLPLALHAYLGVLLLPILLLKELIVRFFKRYFTALPYVGMVIFCVAFLVVAFTGGHYTVLWLKGPTAKVTRDGKRHKVSVALGREILHNKCAQCHELKLPYLYHRTEDEWRNTVTRMSRKDPGLVSPKQADAMVGYLKKELGAAE
ncbi:MAG: hypothetical protein GXP25_09010 [Planctomycetes bacterium]|nr:hypothetical protein [Planctomycetota bacterium]